MNIREYPSERASAQRCADGVNKYWKALGYDVNARVETHLHTNPWRGAFESYVVKSDTVNGLPRGFKRGARSA